MTTETEVQVVSLKDSSNAMNEMVIGIERIADNSVRISELTNETTEFASNGNATVERALQQMDMIKQTVGQSSDKINELSKKSIQIDTIVNVITEIANQTNLLALNAAIEAARAGEHGKGFAVVADEVRKLAEQSRISAAQITELIQTVHKDTIDSVQMMELVSENVNIGINVTEDAAHKFSDILTRMHRLNPQMEDISATATEFSAQAEQVSLAIHKLLEMAQNTSQATGEIAASSAANSLSEMSESLRGLVTQFKV